MKKNLSLDNTCVLIGKGRQREIFCCPISVSLGAYHKYGEKGIKPDVILAVHELEYTGEEILEFETVRYAVTHIYKRDDGLVELTGTKKAGIQNGS